MRRSTKPAAVMSGSLIVVAGKNTGAAIERFTLTLHGAALDLAALRAYQASLDPHWTHDTHAIAVKSAIDELTEAAAETVAETAPVAAAGNDHSSPPVDEESARA